MKKMTFLKEKLATAALGMLPQKILDEKLVAALEKSAPVAEIERLIKAGADVDAGQGRPVAAVVKNNDADYLRLLVRHGADIRIAHEMPLRLAIKLGQMPMAFELVRFGADTRAALIHAELKGDKREAMFLDQWARQFGDSIQRLEQVCRDSKAGKCNCPQPPK